MPGRDSLVIIALSALLSVPVSADTDPDTHEFDRLSVIGKPDAIRRIAGAAHHISAGELARFDYSDINRVLREVPGIYLVEEEGYGMRPSIGMRGSGTDRSSRITLLEDGILAAPAPYSAPAAYYFPTMMRMHALEVRKGSASIKHGPYTTGGALNLVSTPIPGAPSGHASLNSGSFGGRSLHGWYGGSGAAGGWLLETVQQASDGFKRLDGGGDTGYTLSDLQLKLRWTPQAAPDHELSLKLGAVEHDADETYLGLTADDFGTTPYRRYAASQLDELDTRHRQYQLRHTWNVNASIDVTTAVYRNEFSRAWYKLQSVGGASLSNVLTRPGEFPDQLGWLRGEDSPDDALVMRNNYRDYYAQGVQGVLGWRANGAGAQHEIEIGLRLHYDEEDRLQEEDRYSMQDGRMSLTTAGARGSQDNRVGEAEVVAVFVQDEIRAGAWTLTPGLRHERIRSVRRDYACDDPVRAGGPTAIRRNSDSVTIPGIGINRGLGDAWNAFVSVHRGFTPPAPGSDSRAEEGVNYEYGLRYGNGALRGDVTGFHNDYRNLVGICTASTGGGCGIGEQFDGGKVRMHGVETAWRYGIRLDNGWQLPLRFSYTWTDAEFRTGFSSSFPEFGTVEAGDRLAYLPRHQLQVGATLEAGEWQMNLAASWVGEMRTTAGRGETPRTERTDAFSVVDLGVRWQPRHDLALFGRVENLLDDDYIVAWRPAGARPGKPRTVTAGLRIDF